MRLFDKISKTAGKLTDYFGTKYVDTLVSAAVIRPAKRKAKQYDRLAKFYQDEVGRVNPKPSRPTVKFHLKPTKLIIEIIPSPGKELVATVEKYGQSKVP